MNDYYGNIIKSNSEVDQELIDLFKKRADILFIKSLLSNLRIEKVLLDEYSITGWRMFAKKQLYDIINIELNDRLQKNKKKSLVVHGLKDVLNYDILYNIFNA